MARRGENIYKRKDGRYEGRYIKHYDLNGKAIYGYVYSKSYSEIKHKLANCKSGKEQHIIDSNMLLSDWLTSWIKSDINIKDTTRLLYERHIKNNIIPQIGKYHLNKISSYVLQEFVNSMNYSPATVKLIFSIIKSALVCAEEKGLVINTWSKIKLPKSEGSDVIILSQREQRMLESSLTEKNDIGIFICLYTGLRIGELCALKWNDIDFENNLLYVNGTQSRINGELCITPPKSKASKRVIPMPDIVCDRLKCSKNHSDFIISNKGKMVDVRAYRRRFKNILKANGLPDIKFHATRHTFATRALEVGMDYKTLSEILGHASVSITMDLYVHALDEHKKNQMNKLNNIYSPSNSSVK